MLLVKKMINKDYRLSIYIGKFILKKFLLCLIIVVLLVSKCVCLDNTSRNIEDVTNSNISSDLPTIDDITEYSEKMSWWKDCEDIGCFFYDEVVLSKRQITIAVIDAGISESMLYNNKIYTNVKEIANNNKDDDGNGFIDDINGWNFVDNNNDVSNNNKNSVHSTAIMGLLIGEDRKDAYYGLLNDYNVKIVPIKSLNDNTLDGSIDSVIDAIKYAESIQADIVALSFSTFVKSQELENTMKNSKMLFVVAAGNGGRKLEENYMVYPACFKLDNIITVTALGQDGYIDELSNYGEAYVDVAAPGIDIICYLDNKKYVMENGTSFSVPFVVYEASILNCISENKLSPKETKNIICGSASKNNDNLTHSGTINISKAIDSLQKMD